MENEKVVLRKGPAATKPENIVPGTLLIETDTGNAWLDYAESEFDESGHRVQLKDDTKLPLHSQADSAKETDHAKEADHAATADLATQAQNADNAKEADHAIAADSAQTAASANYARDAEFAAEADSATTADIARYDTLHNGITKTYLNQVIQTDNYIEFKSPQGDPLDVKGAAYASFIGSTDDSSGQMGLVPSPGSTDSHKYLKADGTWSYPTTDWNQNEDTGEGYVQNRTHYVELTSQELCAKSNLEMYALQGGTIRIDANTYSTVKIAYLENLGDEISSDNKYTVAITYTNSNDEQISLSADKLAPISMYSSNPTSYGLGLLIDDKIIIAYLNKYPDDGFYIWTISDEVDTIDSIVITTFGPVYRPLDEKYIPSQISSNAASANKLNTARSIDGLLFDGSGNISRYVTCLTDKSTSIKTVTISRYTEHTPGALIIVRFWNGNDASDISIKINQLDAVPIHYRGGTIPDGYITEKQIVMMIFTYNNGEASYEIIG